MLTKLRRNELFEAVVAGDLSPEGFELRESQRSLTLTHRSSGSRLRLRREGFAGAVRVAFVDAFRIVLTQKPSLTQDELFKIEWSTPDERSNGESIDWPHAVALIAKWVAQVREELEAPDLWKALEDGSYAANSTSGDNSPFTVEEQHEIARNVAALKSEYAADTSLDAAQVRQLEVKLDYLVGAAGRMGRLDWRNLVAGTMLGILSEAILPAETTRRVFSALLHSVSHLLGHPIPLLPGPFSAT